MEKTEYNFLAIFSCTGIIAWMATNYFGGMFIWMLSYWYAILPIILLYITSFVNTLTALSNKKFAYTKIRVLCHAAVLLAIAGMILYDSEVFKSKKVLSAVLVDDLFSYYLTLREDGSCELDANGIFGFIETYSGEYLFKGDTIIFTKVPYDIKGFIPNNLLLDKSENALFKCKDKDGNFIRQKSYLNYFKIIPEEN